MAHSLAQEAYAWTRTIDAVGRKRAGIVRYGAVEAVSGAVANVRLEDGQLLSNVSHAAGLAVGTRVSVRGRGKQGGISWGVEGVAKITTEQRSGDPNAIINTPSFARVASGLHAIVNGTPYIYLRLAIWQIFEQYRSGQRVRYEVEIQKSEGADLPLTLSVAEHKQMGAMLAEPIGGGGGLDDDALAITSVYGPNPPEYLFFPFGAADVQGEIIYYDTLGTNELNGLTRGQDTPEGVPTSAVSHDAGEFVLARTVMVETTSLAANTAYRYRVRAIIGDKYSNFSDWETITTAYDTTVPGWSITPTPAVSLVNGLLQVSWPTVDQNTAHLLDYQVQYATDLAFTQNVKNDYTRSTQYSFPFRIGATGYVRVRPRNTSFVAGDWSNTARIAGQRDIAEGRPLANLLTNGAFDSNTTGWSNTGDGVIVHDNSRGFIGPGSLQVEISRTGLGGQAHIQQSVSGLSAGDELYLMAYGVRWSNFDETLDEVYIEIDTGGARYASPVAKGASFEVADNADGEWTVFEASGVVPYGATSATVRLVVEWSGTPSELTFVWFDDVQLYRTARSAKGLQSGAAGSFDTLMLEGINTGTRLTTIEGDINDLEDAVVDVIDDVAALARFHMRYTSNAGQNLTSGSNTIINYEDVGFESVDYVTTGATWKFQPTVAGQYRITASFQMASINWASGDVLVIGIFKNGIAAAFNRAYLPALTAQTPQVMISDIVSFNGTSDYIDVRGGGAWAFGGSRALSTDSRTNYIVIDRV